jgi:uncharacterized membrane protein
MLNRIVLGCVFILAGINHFRRPRMYQAIMPAYLPWHGVAEVLLGGLALFSRGRRPARWGLAALLVAVFPANVHMALHTERYPQIPAWLLWLRLPLQGVLIGWVWWSTRRARYIPML